MRDRSLRKREAYASGRAISSCWGEPGSSSRTEPRFRPAGKRVPSPKEPGSSSHGSLPCFGRESHSPQMGLSARCRRHRHPNRIRPAVGSLLRHSGRCGCFTVDAGRGTDGVSERSSRSRRGASRSWQRSRSEVPTSQVRPPTTGPGKPSRVPDAPVLGSGPLESWSGSLCSNHVHPITGSRSVGR
jgi:hypothetical protein